MTIFLLGLYRFSSKKTGFEYSIQVFGLRLGLSGYQHYLFMVIFYNLEHSPTRVKKSLILLHFECLKNVDNIKKKR